MDGGESEDDPKAWASDDERERRGDEVARRVEGRRGGWRRWRRVVWGSLRVVAEKIPIIRFIVLHVVLSDFIRKREERES